MKKFISTVCLFMGISVTGLAQQTSLGLPHAKDIQQIVQRGELRVAICADSSVPPFIIMNGNQLSGYDADLSQVIATHLGVKLHIDQASSYDEAVSFVASDKDDIADSNLTASYERAFSVFFTNPYYIMPLVLVAKNNFDTSNFQMAQEVISTSSSLNISALANSSNLSYIKVAFPQAIATPYTDLSDAVQSVKNNEYDAILLDKFTAQQAIFGEGSLSIFKLGPAHMDPLAIAVSVNRPQLLMWLNAYLASAEGQAEQTALKRKVRLE
ncbi:MAG: transporter substrate-binding domain-containing protein [Pseudomonadota bacterium]